MKRLIVLAGGAGLVGLLMLGVLALHPTSTRAYSSGFTGRSQSGCSGCHGSAADSNVAVAISGPTTVTPGSTNSYTVMVTGSPAGSQGLGGGLDVSVTGGTLAAGANNQLMSGEITHLDGSSRSWTFSWTAPSTAGSVSMFAAGLSANLDDGTSGDGWNLTSLAITVAAANTPTPTATNTSTPPATDTPTTAPTDTPIPAATDTPTPAPTDTPPPAATDTPASAATDTPTPAATDTSIPTETETATPAATDTSTPSETETPTAVATDTSTPVPTETAAPAATETATPAATDTPVPEATARSDRDDRPGSGCGDDNHAHTGPRGTPDKSCPPQAGGNGRGDKSAHEDAD